MRRSTVARAHRVKNNVRDLRKARGMTQEQLAARVGVHFTTIAKLERAERGMSMDMLASLSRALGVAPIEIISEESASLKQPPMRMVPMLGRIAAGSWRKAIHDPDGAVPVPGAGENAFALTPDGDSMDMLVGPDALIVVDPDDQELREGKIYAVLNGDGESTFKRFRTDPLRLEPVSSNPEHQPILLGQQHFTVIGRIVWQVSAL